MKYLGLILIYILSFEVAHAMSLNDLSVLLPLPESTQMNQLISPSDSAEQGVLLPMGAFKALPQLVPEFENSLVYREQLKVIALRLDPCFIEGVGPQKCRRQIRLVWQPVIAAGDAVTTRDAAVHSFYEFDEGSFAKLWAEWKPLALGNSEEALQIHPQIKAEGLAGPHWQLLKTLVLKYCGERNLVRLTAMNVMPGEQLWIFMGFNVGNGQTSPVNIPRIGRTSQGVIVSSEGFKNFSGRVMPVPTQDSDFGYFVSDSVGFKKHSSESQVRALMTKVLTYENPGSHNPGTLDCVSCHLANSSHQWGVANFPQWNWSTEFAQVTFQSPWNLQNTTQGPLRTNQLRAFGYFHNQPAISQRVINETASLMSSLR